MRTIDTRRQSNIIQRTSVTDVLITKIKSEVMKTGPIDGINAPGIKKRV